MPAALAASRWTSLAESMGADDRGPRARGRRGSKPSFVFLVFLLLIFRGFGRRAYIRGAVARGAVKVLEDSRLAVCVSELWALIS
jgi:hypothetical protein